MLSDRPHLSTYPILANHAAPLMLIILPTTLELILHDLECVDEELKNKKCLGELLTGHSRVRRRLSFFILTQSALIHSENI